MDANGYIYCACRDCFDIAIGDADTLCHECESAGCEANNGDCCRPDAYGADEGDDNEFGSSLAGI